MTIGGIGGEPAVQGPETAGRLMTRRVLFAQLGETVGSLRHRIATEPHDVANPAFGSGPVATIIQDVLSILIYVLAVAAILP